MNWLFFCGGLGLGAALGTISTIWSIGWIGKSASEEGKKQNKITADLMQERNRLDAIKVEHLSWIATSLSKK